MGPPLRNLARLRLFLQRTSLIGLSPSRTLLWELPRLLGWRLYSRMATIAYALADRLRLMDRNLAQALRPLEGRNDPCFHVIVVPRMLHFLIPAVQLIEQRLQITFILNGISHAEHSILAKRFPHIPQVHLRTLPGSCWPHGHVLNLLLRNSGRDFGILDHDFYLFDPGAIDQLRFQGEEFAICATQWRNRSTGMAFPGTHFLYVRTSVLRELMTRFGVGAQIYKQVPAGVKPVLTSMGLSRSNPPKEYQSFFDSLLMLSALALHEGYGIRPLETAHGDWIHVGGTSIGLQISKSALHHYISSRFLALYPDVAANYLGKGHVSPEHTDNLRAALDAKTAERVDALVQRVASRTGNGGPGPEGG